MSELPPGFVLEGAPATAPPAASSVPGLPDGFVLEGAPPAPTPYKGGMLPISRDAQGHISFDSNAGIIGALKSGLTLARDVQEGTAKLPSSGAVPGSVPFGDPASSGERVADMATLAVPINPAVRAGDLAFPGVQRAVRPVAPPAIEANLAAQNIGVDLPRAIGSDSPLTRFMGQVSNKMPGGGPMQERIGSAVRQTGEAVENAAQMAGGAADPMAAGQGFRTGIETSFKPTIKARVGAAYDEVGKHVDPNFTRPLDATQGAIADIISRRLASGEEDSGKAIKTVLGGATRPGGLTFEGVKDLRTRIGEMLDTGVFPEGMSQHELRRVYGSLSDDLKATVQASGGDKGMAAFERANAAHKFAEDWKDNIGKVLGSDRSGEGVTAAILRMANNGSTGDLKALTMARAAVPKPVWQDVASTAVSSLGKDRKGEFSPAIFMNDFAKLSDRGKVLLFGDVGSGNVLAHLNDISSVSKKFVEAGKLSNTSGTAGHNAAYTMLGGGAAGLLHGSLLEPVTALGTVVGNNLLARALSAPASAASVARWVRTYDAVATSRTPRSVAALNIASRNLANTVNAQFGSKLQPTDLLKALQGPAKSAADNNQQN